MAESIVVAIIGAVGAIIVAIVQRIKKGSDSSPAPVTISPEDHSRIVDEFENLLARQGRIYSKKLSAVEDRLDTLEEENRVFSDLLSRAFELLNDILNFESDISDSTRRRIRSFLKRIKKEDDDGTVSP